MKKLFYQLKLTQNYLVKIQFCFQKVYMSPQNSTVRQSFQPNVQVPEKEAILKVVE